MIESVEVGNFSRSGITEVSGGVEGSDFTSGGFSTLEAYAKKRADERDGGLFELSSGDGMVRLPQVETIVEQGRVGGEKSRYYPSQSAKSLLKDFFELNPPTHLDPSHPTTSFSEDQMIQFSICTCCGVRSFSGFIWHAGRFVNESEGCWWRPTCWVAPFRWETPVS